MTIQSTTSILLLFFFKEDVKEFSQVIDYGNKCSNFFFATKSSIIGLENNEFNFLEV
jgi:hypothetical protein